jgi:hypothetical protein
VVELNETTLALELQEIKLKSANKVHNEWFGDDKSRVYLAKSNRANPNIVSNVRITLNNFDVDVIEYSGGQYSNNALLSCDYLVVVPESTPNLTDLSSEISIGKGLYEQIESLLRIMTIKMCL